MKAQLLWAKEKAEKEGKTIKTKDFMQMMRRISSSLDDEISLDDPEYIKDKITAMLGSDGPFAGIVDQIDFSNPNAEIVFSGDEDEEQIKKQADMAKTDAEADKEKIKKDAQKQAMQNVKDR